MSRKLWCVLFDIKVHFIFRTNELSEEIPLFLIQTSDALRIKKHMSDKKPNRTGVTRTTDKIPETKVRLRHSNNNNNNNNK